MLWTQHKIVSLHLGTELGCTSSDIVSVVLQSKLEFQLYNMHRKSCMRDQCKFSRWKLQFKILNYDHRLISWNREKLQVNAADAVTTATVDTSKHWGWYQFTCRSFNRRIVPQVHKEPQFLLASWFALTKVFEVLYKNWLQIEVTI